MPNGSRQEFWIYGTSDAINLFQQIAQENIMNINPISLQQRLIKKGETVSANQQVFVTESQVYRFLANKLCESCNVQRTISKYLGAIFFVKTNSGTLCTVEAYWLDDMSEWCVRIIPIDSSYTYISKKDRSTFY